MPVTCHSVSQHMFIEHLLHSRTMLGTEDTVTGEISQIGSI